MTHVVHQPNEGGDWIRSKVFDRRSATEAPSTGGADDQTAAEVPITDAGGYFTGTDVEAALQELGASVAALGGGSGISIGLALQLPSLPVYL
jgi:NAD(P)H-dependent flavin oxidoreductase YrpB (nitropropane dioxygenase family)